MTVKYELAAATEYQAVYEAIAMLPRAYRYIGHTVEQMVAGWWRVSIKVEDTDA